MRTDAAGGDGEMDRCGSLQRFRRNVYSQNGEDGVLREIFRRLERPIGWFCEFGAWDGRYGSNAYNLLLRGWRGVMIEGDHHRFQRLRRLGDRYGDRLEVIEAMVSSNRSEPTALDKLLSRTRLPSRFDMLSIDVDGYDYQIWESLEQYHPRVVIIEIDSSIFPGPSVVHGPGGNGSSFSAMLRLGRRKGYALVAHTGNMIFVSEEEVERLGLPASDLAYPERLFVAEWVNPTWLSTIKRKLRNATPQRVAVKVDNLLHEKVLGHIAEPMTGSSPAGPVEPKGM
jgi:hypothetical protein